MAFTSVPTLLRCGMHGLHGLLGMHGMHLEDRRRPVVARGAPVVKQVETCRDFALNQGFMRVHSELVITSDQEYEVL